MARTLKKGNTGKDVVVLQTLLIEKGYGPTATDGDFGAITDALVKQFQADHGLKADGIVGDKTWNAMYAAPVKVGKSKPAHSGKYTAGVKRAWSSYGDTVTAAGARMSIEPAALIAVIAVESAGSGVKNGKPLIRFENHLLSRQIDAALYAKHFKHNAKEPWKGHQMYVNGSWVDVHTGDQASEYQALDLAVSVLPPEAKDLAYRCASYGAPQILGSWFKRLGYNGAESMFDSFHDESKQIAALFRFLTTSNGAPVNSDAGMAKDLAAQDWLTFAKKYNGPGQAKYYADLLADAYKAAVAESP